VGLSTERHLAHVAVRRPGWNDLSHGLGLHLATLRENDDSAPPADEPDPRVLDTANSPVRPMAATGVTWCPHIAECTPAASIACVTALAARTGIPLSARSY
jgi:hypothetical protein